MKALRRDIAAEDDLGARSEMRAMYMEVFREACKAEEAERPMHFTRSFIRSSFLYALVTILFLCVLTYFFGPFKVLLIALTVMAVFVIVAAFALRTANRISEAGLSATIRSGTDLFRLALGQRPQDPRALPSVSAEGSQE